MDIGDIVVIWEEGREQKLDSMDIGGGEFERAGVANGTTILVLCCCYHEQYLLFLL